MSYASPQYPSQQPARRGKPWLLIIGAIIALLSIVLCCGGGFMIFSKSQEITQGTERTGSHTLTLEDGEKIGVWSANELNICSATGPAGPVQDSGTASQTVSWGDKEYERTMEVTAEGAGEYTVTCTSPFVIGDSLATTGFIGVGVGGLLGCFAFVLLAIGFVVWLIRRGKN